ncbi:hypothetical protein KO505_12875 [Psychrosphaera sp. F3M07]|uniref:hypothetical protein n=1 Tax=Psychrosphaera sp. F3M07 TaxID=2841560 RepID=UPI001C087C35|nr:hypothetical protein [Psychrosphaera sp. F3M07]MBU2918842.1 hypothetical protein [Psychrosphaera sp. F3M07]
MKFINLFLILILLAGCGSEDSDKDISPDAFEFSSKVDVELNSYVITNGVIVTGIDNSTPISITGGEISISNSEFTTESSNISAHQSLRVRLLSAARYQQTTTATVTVGDYSTNFSVTTKAEPSVEPPVVEQPVEPPLDGSVTVDINYNLRHTVGGIDTFDRQKFITIHSDLPEHDWFDNDSFSLNSPNEVPDLISSFLQGYDVYLGRTTGGITWNLNQIKQDPAKPGFASESDATTRGNNAKWSYNNLPTHKQSVYDNEDRAVDMIVGAQQHPFWPEGTLTKGGGWALSQADTADEPIGTATGHYISQFLHKFFDQIPNDNIRDGQSKPKYFEVMNEPLYDLTTVRSGADSVEPADVFRFHNTVANEIRKNHNDVLVGGYTTAFPDFDKDNFQRWLDRDKLFIDIAGENMDFYSIHLYDFPTFQNSERYRRGSNVEATLDMLESYSLQTFGETRPLVISEYGAQVHDHIGVGWTPIRNTHSIRATNSMLMQFMERPDMILKTIPFIVVKAEWGRNNSIPYGPRLMIQKFERDGAGTGNEWVYSDLVTFYQLWANVNGTRVDTKATDIDVQTDAYVDGNKAYVIINSLEFEGKDVNLNHLGLADNTINQVTINHLTTLNDGSNGSVINTTTLSSLPESITLDAEATIIIEIEFADAITIDQTLTEQKYYSDLYLETISSSNLIEFKIDDVTVPTNGEAVLRISLGRDHNKSLIPELKVNGTRLTVPTDFRGYNQQQGRSKTGRENFYGVIEVPVPLQYLQQNNQLSLSFSDNGGKVASVALQVFDSSITLNRFESGTE